MKETTKMVMSMFLVTVIATALLSFVYALTAPIIAAQKQLSLSNDLKQFFPNSDEVKVVNQTYQVFEKGNLVGYAALTSAKGYSSTISLLVAIGLDHKVVGISVLSQQETPGLGSKVQDQSFLSQFIGKSDSELSLRKYGGQIDGITSATISSKAVTEAVRLKVEEIK
ncbi:MAG: RnfABCDGE type electron transport complex subunit G [Candidatus Woesearchaeota archaeon]